MASADDDDTHSIVSEAPLSDIELPDAPPAPVESLVAGRTRRSNAGNLLAQLLAQEADEEDTLFLEDEDDVEFTAKDTNDYDDIPLESSSEDEDEGPPPIGGDGEEDLEGEHALQLAEKRAKRANKRKADDTFFKKRAAPVREKRVTIREDKDVTGATATEARSSVAGSPAPDGDGYTALTRPRKKSERISWVPEFVATRASSRTLSLQNRETTMKRLEESEKRRLHTIALMEAAAARKVKKTGPRKEMTQEERLAEARITERRNLKSLNRWERMEEEKLEEQRRKLAALQNRKLAGPVITYWSGRAEWDGTGKLVKLGKKLIEEIEDESGKKKKKPAPKPEDKEKLEREKAEKEKALLEASTLPDKIKAEDPPDTPMTGTTDPLSSLAPTINPLSLAPSEASPAPESKPATTPPPAVPPIDPLPLTDIITPEIITPSELESTAPTPILETNLLSSNPPLSPTKAAPSPETALEAVPGAAPEATSGSTPAAPETAPETAPEDPSAPPAPPSPPHEASARNLILLENFEGEDTLRDKTAVMKVLCGNQIKRPGILHAHAKPICIITHQPAQFCDPRTGMPYSSLQAYQTLKRILKGEIKWSPVMGGFIGQAGVAAKGVPEGF